MLLARPVLREEAGQMAAVHVQDHLGAIVEEHAPDRVLWKAPAEQGIGLVTIVGYSESRQMPQSLRASRAG